jgi:hypothetical protein
MSVFTDPYRCQRFFPGHSELGLPCWPTSQQTIADERQSDNSRHYLKIRFWPNAAAPVAPGEIKTDRRGTAGKAKEKTK